MKTLPLWLAAGAVALAGCAKPIPYRLGALEANPACASVYAAYDARDPAQPAFSGEQAEHPCWQRSVEEHAAYDLLFAEFTDQGWVQGSSNLERPAPDYMDAFLAKVRALQRDAERKGFGLSMIVFVHGWHHSAQAADPDVVKFRKFLADMAATEEVLARHTGKPKRVLGIFVGWRGESLRIPWLNELTFWERKNTAERVALGSVRELLKRLDYFRDRSRDTAGARNVRMLTIGHSFGGLITYAAMGGEFVRDAARFKERRPGSNQFDKFMSRFGDLVLIVNPAFEGARYEPLHTAGQRLCGVEPNQLPVLVVATSRGDSATRVMFPLARQLSTLLERDPGLEGDAIVKAVGHNERYITHELELCKADDQACRNACEIAPRAPAEQARPLGIGTVEREYQFMQRFADRGFGYNEYLCGGMSLNATKQWYPKDNPFWVVRTTKEVIADHGDIFNANFIAFFRQLYVGFVYARAIPDDGVERNPCKDPP